MSDLAQLRCSGLDKLLSCPGSYTIEKKVLADSFDTGDENEIGGTEVTWAGNWCHWEAARRLIEFHGAIAPAGGLQPPVLPKDWKPTVWEVRKVEWFVSMLMTATPPDHAIYVEHGFTWKTGRFVLTGHIDVFTVSPDGETVHWSDQKTGMKEVDPADINWQLGGYGAIIKADAVVTAKTGLARILQKSSSSPMSEVEIDDMDRLLPFMEGKINAALDNPYEFNTGAHCTYCIGARSLICPAFRAEITRMKMLLTKEEVERLKTVPDLEELAAVVFDLRKINGAGEAITESLRERLMTKPGRSVALASGMVAELVDENGPKKATAPKAIFDFLSPRIEEVRLWDCFKVGFGDLEDALVETGMKRTSKKEESAAGVIKSMSHLYEQTTVAKLKFRNNPTP